MENIYIVEKIYNEENKKDGNAHHRIIMHKIGIIDRKPDLKSWHFKK